MASCWIIGRRVQMQNGTYYMAEPFVAFEQEADADAACEMVFRVSGERPMKADAAMYRVGETKRPGEAP